MDSQYDQGFTNQLFRAPDLNSYHDQPNDISPKFNDFTPTDESLMFDGLLGDADLHQSSFSVTTGISFPGNPANAVFNFDKLFVFPSDQSFVPLGVTQHSPLADTYKNNAPLQQRFAPFQYNLNNRRPYDAAQIQQSTDFQLNGIYQPQQSGVLNPNPDLLGFNQGIPPVQQQLLPNPPKPDPGFFPYFDHALNTNHQQIAGNGGLSDFHDGDVHMIGGFSDTDYLKTSFFDIDVEAVRAYYSNASSPRTLMGNRDMSGRGTSEPLSIGESPFRNDPVAQMRHQTMQQQASAFEQSRADYNVPMMMKCTPAISTSQAIQKLNPKEKGRSKAGGQLKKQGSKLARVTCGQPSSGLAGFDYPGSLNFKTMATATTTISSPSPTSLTNGEFQRTFGTMGNDLSRESRDSLRHNLRIVDHPAAPDALRGNGWTSVNGSGDDRQPRQEPNPSNIQTDGIKRKRSPPISSSNGIAVDTSDRTANTSAQPLATHTRVGIGQQPAQTGLGITVPAKARTISASSGDSVIAPTVKPARPVGDGINTHGSGNPGKLVVNGRDGSKSGKEHANFDDAESGSDVDTDALGFLQRVAAAESDDEEEPAAVAPKPRPIRPTSNIAPHGWRPPPQPVGTHYTIYSPLVQHPAYTQPRPPPESFDPTAPLSAHEEAQLRDEGRFTKMEQSFLKDAIDEYCKKHNISVELANDYVCGKAREGNIPGNFWDEVCRALPQRTKNSIQRAAKRVFRNNQKKGSWTTEEETALAAAYHKAPDQWAKICEEVPGRSAEQCRDRWRNYTSNGVQLTRGPWSEDEETQFIEICKAMLHQARRDRDEQRRQGRTLAEEFDPIDHLNFTAISTMMQGKRSRLHCRNKWHKLKKRPDVEAVIESIVKGRPIDTTVAPQPNGPLAPKAPIPPVSAPSAANTPTSVSPAAHQPLAQHAPEPQQLPPVSQALASLLPPSAHPGASRAAAGPSCAHLFPLTVNSAMPASSQASQPPPATAFNMGQGRNGTAAEAQDARTASTSAPPRPIMMNRPSLPPPILSAPAVARTSTLPAILSPVSEPSAHPPASTTPISTSAPPSWANAPPPAPQIFAPPNAFPPNLPASHHRPTPGPKRVVSTTVAGANATGPSFYYNGTQLPIVTAHASLEKMPHPGSSAHYTRGPMLAPITSISPPQHEGSQPMSKADTATRGTPFILPSVAVPSYAADDRSNQNTTTPEAAAFHNGHEPSARTTASPDSAASHMAEDDNIDGRPVRKKQKTAKARGEE